VIDRLNAGESDLDSIWYDAMHAFPSNSVDYYYITALHREWCGNPPVPRDDDAKFDRNAYQRQYMRQWRRKKRLERLANTTGDSNSEE
jgi:hypothetical protein